MSTPVAVRNSSHSGVLKVEWPGGRVQVLTHGQLRARCPCSHCRAARLRGRIDVVNPEVRITQVVDQGYGLQVVFSDGHDRGIYPWAYVAGLG